MKSEFCQPSKFDKMKKVKTPLSTRDQLRNIRTKHRERIFLHKIFFDLKIAAIAAKCKLQTYEVEVDDAGYDIIIDSGYSQRRFQLKTRMLPGGATQWSCHSQLFCPTPEQARDWDFEEWNMREAWGYNGGLILADIDWSNDPSPIVSYKYCDLSILMAYRDGFSILRKNASLARHVWKQTLLNPYSGNKRRTQFPQSLLVRPKDNVSLLGLMGFGLGIEGHYITNFRKAYSKKSRPRCNALCDEEYKQLFFRTLTTKLV